jgi:sulfite exporter TauE/SafE
MVTEEQLKCNICGGIIVSASQAKEHASTSSHKLNKLKLEQELNAVRIENYQNESSVVIGWERSSV